MCLEGRKQSSVSRVNENQRRKLFKSDFLKLSQFFFWIRNKLLEYSDKGGRVLLILVRKFRNDGYEESTVDFKILSEYLWNESPLSSTVLITILLVKILSQNYETKTLTIETTRLFLMILTFRSNRLLLDLLNINIYWNFKFSF